MTVAPCLVCGTQIDPGVACVSCGKPAPAGVHGAAEVSVQREHWESIQEAEAHSPRASTGPERFGSAGSLRMADPSSLAFSLIGREWKRGADNRMDECDHARAERRATYTRAIVLLMLAALAARPLEAQSLRDRFLELYCFSEHCGEPLSLDVNADEHGDHFNPSIVQGRADALAFAAGVAGSFQIGENLLHLPEPVVFTAPEVRTVELTPIPDHADHFIDASFGFKVLAGPDLRTMTSLLLPLNDAEIGRAHV